MMEWVRRLVSLKTLSFIGRYSVRDDRKKKRLIEGNANCRHKIGNSRCKEESRRLLKKLTCTGTLWQMFIRVYKLEIQSVMLVFSTQSTNLFSGSTLPPLSMCE
jgi:hypothetical protein